MHFENVPGDIAAGQRAEGLAGLDLLVLVPAGEGGPRVLEGPLDQVRDLDPAREGLAVRALELTPAGSRDHPADRCPLEDPLSGPVGLAFLGGLGRHDRQVMGSAGFGRLGLLDNVRQLVAQEAEPLARLGPVVPLGEGDVLAHGVGLGPDGPARRVGPGVGMHADPAEVVAEQRFQLVPEPLAERAAGRRQDLAHDPRGDRQLRRPAGRLPVEPALRARWRIALRIGTCAARDLAPTGCRGRAAMAGVLASA